MLTTRVPPWISCITILMDSKWPSEVPNVTDTLGSFYLVWSIRSTQYRPIAL